LGVDGCVTHAVIRQSPSKPAPVGIINPEEEFLRIMNIYQMSREKERQSICVPRIRVWRRLRNDQQAEWSIEVALIIPKPGLQPSIKTLTSHHSR
jgi:hypothetical protein